MLGRGEGWTPAPPEGSPASLSRRPDGVQRGLVGKIIQRFEEKGFYLRGACAALLALYGSGGESALPPS